MGSPICKKDWAPVNWGSSVCDLLRGLLLTNERLFAFFGWMFGENCKLTPEFGAEMVEMFTPIGSTFWSPLELDVDPEVWVKCDGTEYDKTGTYEKLYAVVKDDWSKGPNWRPPTSESKFRVPDLRGRFQMTAGKRVVIQPDPPVTPPIPDAPLYSVAEVGGDDEVRLEHTHIAEHAHGIGGRNDNQVPKVTGAGSAEDIGGVPWLGSPQAVHDYEGQYVDMFLKPLGSHVGYNRVDQSTTEQITPYFNAKLGEPHPNIPPFLGGNTYMRANYKINGKLVP